MRRLRSEKGFTLVEVVAVAAILAIMSAIMYGTLNGLLRSQALIEAGGTTERAARAFFSRFVRELQSKVPEKLSAQNSQSSTSGTISGASPFSPMLGYMDGTDEKKSDLDLDSIRFVTDGGATEVIGESGFKGRVEVEYRLVDTEKVRGEKSNDNEWTLVRVESPAGVPTTDPNRVVPTVVYPMFDHVISLNFRYLSNDQWVEEWKNLSGQFPIAIETTLQMKDEDGTIQTFQTVTALGQKRAPGFS